jgi:hypothetical protein
LVRSQIRMARKGGDIARKFDQQTLSWNSEGEGQVVSRDWTLPRSTHMMRFLGAFQFGHGLHQGGAQQVDLEHRR